MPIKSSGSITLTDVAAEFGGSNPDSLQEYYSGGQFVPAGTLSNKGPIPASGPISYNDFYGARRRIIKYSGITTASSQVSTVSIPSPSEFVAGDTYTTIGFYGANHPDRRNFSYIRFGVGSTFNIDFQAGTQIYTNRENRTIGVGVYSSPTPGTRVFEASANAGINSRMAFVQLLSRPNGVSVVRHQHSAQGGGGIDVTFSANSTEVGDIAFVFVDARSLTNPLASGMQAQIGSASASFIVFSKIITQPGTFTTRLTYSATQQSAHVFLVVRP